MKTTSKTITSGFLGLFMMLMLTLTLTPGCDILSDNPLIVDGTTLDIRYTIRTGVNDTEFDVTETVDLQEILDDVEDNVESISMYDIRLRVFNLVNTPSSTRYTGTMSVNGINVLSVNNMPLSTFTTERTIFDTSLQAEGATVHQAGIDYLMMLMQSQPLPVINARFTGSSSRVLIEFTVEAKIYTQVFTRP